MARAIDAESVLKELMYGDVYTGETFEEYMSRVIVEAPTIEPKQEWISVKDRLPEEYTRVLTYSHADGVMIGSMDYDGDFRFPYCLLPDEPTHWMPLPEPPEREGE